MDCATLHKHLLAVHCSVALLSMPWAACFSINLKVSAFKVIIALQSARVPVDCYVKTAKAVESIFDLLILSLSSVMILVLLQLLSACKAVHF